MKQHQYDRAFAAGMALVVILILALMQATCNSCTIKSTQSLIIKKAQPCAAKK